MVTNLVFKRTANVEGSSRTEMKIIEVLIPELKSSEGWTLVSNADKVDQIKIQEGGAIPPEVKAEQAEEDAAAEFLKKYRADKEAEREKLKMQLSACSCSSKPDPNITAYNGCADTEVRYTNKLEAEVNNGIISFTGAGKINASDEPQSKQIKKPIEYPSPIEGTACLIRRNDTIRIAYREGKRANINTPNKICISDQDKQSFFNAVRACNPTSVINKWVLTPKDHHYKHWNEFIDNEYKEQQREYIHIKYYEKK